MKLLHRIAPTLLALALCTILFFTLDDYGIAWDENLYFPASDSYIAWLKQPSIATIEQYWWFNHEHPPLLKVLAGSTKLLFHDALGVLGTIPAYRLAALPFAFVLYWFLFRFADELYGLPVALIVTLSFFFLPRAFFHAHLTALDYPITALGFVVAYAYWKEIHGHKWPWITAVLLGISLLTKINAFFFYIPILIYWAYFYRQQILWGVLKGPRPDRRERIECYTHLVPLFIIPAILFVAGWPWLWKDTFGRIVSYLLFHGRHGNIAVYYLGTTYEVAPWHYPLVMLLVTIPLVTLVPLLAGPIVITLRRSWRTYLFVALNAAVTIFLLALPVPKYDGERLLLPAVPFLCLIAGAGIYYAVQWIRAARLRAVALSGYALLLLVSINFSTIRTHPYQSSYFNETVGGVDGAARRGFEVDYWGNSFRGLLPWLDEHPGDTFWFPRGEVDSYLLNAFSYYLQDGLLKQPVRFGDKEDSDYMILLIRQGFFTAEMWRYYTTQEPVFATRLYETSLAAIYRLRK